MIPFPTRLFVLFAVPAMVVLGGCGSSASSSNSTSTPQSTASTLPTPKVPPTPEVSGSVAAIVNGHSIPLSQFKLLLNLAQRSSTGQAGTSLKTLTDQTMNEIIIDEIINEYAAAHHLAVSDAELNAQEQKDEKQAGGKAAFVQRLAQFGLTLATYRTLVKPNLLGQKVEQQIAPVKQTLQPVAHVRHILIAPHGKHTKTDAAAKALAQKLLAEIQHGTSFAQLARQYSDDPGSGQQGGDLGNVSPGQTVPAFNQASFNEPPHHPVIVHTQFGYHIVEVLSRSQQQTTKPADQQKQRTQFIAWINDQKRHATIKKVAKVKGA